MKLGLPYVITDFRKVPPERRMRMVGVIQQYPGGLSIFTDNGSGISINLEENDAALAKDDEANGEIVFELPEGRVVLTVLDLAGYEETVKPLLEASGPTFKTDAECQAYWVGRILEDEGR
jgi:hypothetical protein